jgi:hypothetical protein
MTERESEIHHMYVRGYIPIQVAIDILRMYEEDVMTKESSDDDLRQEVDRRVREFARRPAP